jgi:hypothetical protein
MRATRHLRQAPVIIRKVRDILKHAKILPLRITYSCVGGDSSTSQLGTAGAIEYVHAYANHRCDYNQDVLGDPLPVSWDTIHTTAVRACIGAGIERLVDSPPTGRRPHTLRSLPEQPTPRHLPTRRCRRVMMVADKQRIGGVCGRSRVRDRAVPCRAEPLPLGSAKRMTDDVVARHRVRCDVRSCPCIRRGMARQGSCLATTPTESTQGPRAT